jgi:peptidoglycan/xylan/chitin deacetylase (PgdA/CDA1 family)
MKKRKTKTDEIRWPKKYRCAVILGFDFDAESDEMRTAPDKLVPITKGKYGATVGLDRIFNVLDDFSIPATFFVPGWVAENYGEKVKEIQSKGFEIAGHAYLHEKVSELSVEDEKRVLEKCISRIRQVTGADPKGYRAPWFDLRSNSLNLLAEFGFEYDSSLMNQDLPYFIKSSPAGKLLVELPVDWCLDDWPAFEMDRKSTKMVHETWQSEFDALYSAGSLFNLTMHPECIGRPARIEMLRGFIQYMQSKHNVWFASAGEVSKWWRSTHSEDRPVEFSFSGSRGKEP